MAATGTEGSAHWARGGADGKHIGSGDPGPHGGGTYTADGMQPTIEDYENVFGPAARDIKFDTQRSKRHQRWHLPDALTGPNPWLTDRVDGLITDATSSPFTTAILPYRYIENPDAKLKWNVWSFDEGMASRVPYESAARVLTQTKKSFAGYTVRQGLAITMEHNFMKSAAGMETSRNQLQQMVGSIQYSNDFDVHMALISAPSYARTVAEKYFSSNKNPSQIIREYIDLFGIIQKNPNALDLLIEEAKAVMKNWGGKEPTFLLTNPKLTIQLQMSPERTNYVTQGYDGIKRLRTGPNIDSYRNLNIVKSRAFSLDDGVQPRDVLRRRVRVAEYYRIIPNSGHKEYQLYDQSKDAWFTLTLEDLYNMSTLPGESQDGETQPGETQPGETQPGETQQGGEKQGEAQNKFVWKDFHQEGRQVAKYPDDGNRRLPKNLYNFGVRNATRNAGTETSRSLPASETSHSLPALPFDSKTWFDSPYNNKIALLPSIGSVHLSGDGAKTLSCGTVYYDDKEKKFSQTASQGTNHITSSSDHTRDAYICASAWLGGGLFCDTTYHFCPTNTLERPLCNWSSLHVDEGHIPGSSNSDSETMFRAYRPNSFAFKWENQHSIENLMLDTKSGFSQEQVIAGSFANMEFNKETCEFLLGKCGLENDVVAKECYFLLVPHMSITTDHKEIVQKLGLLDNDGKNPWKTVLMTLLMAVIHPNENVRNTAKVCLRHTGINFESLGSKLKSLLRNYSSNNEVQNHVFGDELSNQLYSGVTENIQQNQGLYDQFECAKTGNETVPTHARILQAACKDKSHEDIVRLFALTAAKRMFWGAARFNTDTSSNPYGLSILSRENACLVDANRGPKFGPAHPSNEDSAEHEYRAGDDKPVPIIHPSLPVEPTWQEFLESFEYVIVRPNIEHEMLGVIIGRGGMEDLGATLWGQTELSCYDDAQHGVWGMSYKYHERAQVFNEKHMIRLWDIAFDGYNGGMDDQVVKWGNMENFCRNTNDMSKPYNGESFFVMRFKRNGKTQRNWPNPLVFFDDCDTETSSMTVDPECIHNILSEPMRVFKGDNYRERYRKYRDEMPDFGQQSRVRKPAGLASASDETSSLAKLAFQGSLRVITLTGSILDLQTGCGHLGPSYVGVASVRDGKGYKQQGAPTLGRLV